MKAIKDSAIYLIGELLSRAIPFLLLPYLSRKLGVEGFGELSYYQTFTVLFFILVGLSQEGAVTRYFYVYGKRSLDLVVSIGYIYTLVSGSLILLVCWLLQSEIMAYIALSAIFQSFLGVQLSIRQCQKQAIPYTIIQFLSSVLSVIFTILLLEYFDKELVEKRILAILFANVVVFLFSYFIYKDKKRKKKFQFNQYKTALMYLFGFGVPLILHNASLFLKGQLDRIFIFHQFSEADLGLYAMGAQIAAILMIVLQAINKASIPYFFDGLKQKRISLAQVHKWAIGSFIIVPLPALLMWLIPESVVVWLLGNQFIGTKYYIVLFLFSTGLVIPYFILVNYLFYCGKNNFISICSVISTLAYIVSLIGLTFTKIEYVPYASIIGSIIIIPVLFFMTKRVEKQQ
ncbi:oligosaccharide flippase family protein [Ursidibacter maritimus]|uniref:Oligosaccharide flippase family protein n=4 Tax=Ursidibacter maritimus TaxID=1331689 RepID=A0A949T1R1_9PAST|nr:oligosaccharide flippase family protein [Ursidibacter maritimus]KAE9538961.1 Lsg locus protein 1 [Ursidibacter maritimus]MBV6526287.1 oligosaccharide flippase family protein [Ursidibacter maritimus]MBV6528489.1 oligosaccharide flippase family protein [Ursidibacter maritimus]MBV6531820.1 oligosaccharide flippase family protein [Ursidibacter maritimus]MBV6533932.1 oligosaccharide flippase family protein [Ursidibacter maritimus]